MAEIGYDDVGAAGKPYARERRTGGRAQLRFAARVAPEAKRMTRMRLHGERHVVEHGKIEKQRGDLNERARPSWLRRSVGNAVTSRPSKRMRPASAAISPASWPIRVVLPAPFGPMMA